MKQERILQIIKGPHVTEKSSLVARGNQLVFKVASNATKQEIKTAVEGFLEVAVSAVNIVNVNGKTKRFNQRLGRRKDYKKAYVSLDKSVDMESLLSEQV